MPSEISPDAAEYLIFPLQKSPHFATEFFVFDFLCIRSEKGFWAGVNSERGKKLSRLILGDLSIFI